MNKPTWRRVASMVATAALALAAAMLVAYFYLKFIAPVT